MDRVGFHTDAWYAASIISIAVLHIPIVFHNVPQWWLIFVYFALYSLILAIVLQLNTASTSQKIVGRNLVESENDSDIHEVIVDALLIHFGNLLYDF